MIASIGLNAYFIKVANDFIDENEQNEENEVFIKHELEMVQKEEKDIFSMSYSPN